MLGVSATVHSAMLSVFKYSPPNTIFLAAVSVLEITTLTFSPCSKFEVDELLKFMSPVDVLSKMRTKSTF